MHMASRRTSAAFRRCSLRGNSLMDQHARAIVMARPVTWANAGISLSRQHQDLLQRGIHRQSVRYFCAAKSDGHGKDKQKPPEKQQEEDEGGADAGSQDSNRGTTVTLLGMSGFALSLFLRNPLAARALRIAGPGGMLVGAVISIYEFGGWRLLVSIPLLVAGTSGAGHLLDASYEDKLKKEIAQDLRDGCPEVPPDLMDATQSAHGCQYETNRIRLYAECNMEQQDAAPWSLECLATRPSGIQPWSVSALRVSRAGDQRRREGGDGCPPPQTRFWNPEHGGPVSWQLVWQK